MRSSLFKLGILSMRSLKQRNKGAYASGSYTSMKQAFGEFQKFYMKLPRV